MDAPNAYVIEVYKCISQVGQKEHNIGNVLTGFDESAHNFCNPFQSNRC